MSFSSDSWRELYIAAMSEPDPIVTLKLVSIGLAAIRERLQELPNGLADLNEMKEIKVAIRQLQRLRRRAIKQTDRQFAPIAVISTLRRLIRAT